jgi:hypothetical protein
VHDPSDRCRNTVGGNIQIKDGGPNLGVPAWQEVLICGATLPNGNIEVANMTIARGLILDNSYCSAPNILENGNIKVEGNRLTAGEGMRIGQQFLANGNLHVFKNKGALPKSVMQNTVVNGDIQCYENDPPFVGGPNSGRAPNQPPVAFPPLTGKNQCVGTST